MPLGAVIFGLCKNVARVGAPLLVIGFVPLATGCGPTSESEQHSHAGTPTGEIQLSNAVVQRLGVRVAVAEYGALSAAVTAVGVVSYHADTIADIYAPTSGWIENISVHTAGEPLRKGESLFDLYSPSLATVDEQYLSAVNSGVAPAINPYSGGLRAIGLTEDMIAALRAKQRSPGRIPFRANTNGVIVELDLKPGILVAQGDRLLRSAAVDPIAVTLSVPETDAGTVAEGSPVSITATAYAGKRFSGRIDLVYPDVDPTTRTVRARAVVENRDGLLKANMFVTAQVESEGQAAVHIPREAVIRGQENNDRVVMALGDGRFASRRVTIGRASGDRLTILNGIEQGDLVVTSGIFLIDSETSLKSGLGRMEPSQPMEHQHSPTGLHQH